MSDKLPVVTAAQLVAALSRAGFVRIRQSGSHVFLRNPDGRSVVVPMHAREVPTGTLRAVLRTAKVTVRQLRDLLT